MADNPLETMLAESQDAIGRAIVVLLRAQGCPSKGPFVAVGNVVRDHHGTMWYRTAGTEAAAAARGIASLLNDAYRLGLASAEAER